MLNAPISDTKTESAHSKSQLAPQPGRELHPHSFGAAGAYALSGAGSAAPVRYPGAQRHQIIAGMQATHGNQAVLRMMQSSPQVARMPTLRPSQSVMLQRKCACGGSMEAEGECAECKAKREAALQRRAMSQDVSPTTNTVPPIVHDVLRSSGQPLDAGTRTFIEPRFGYDFSQVRVHTDSKAAESARAVNALAYTVGQHVVLGTGQYTPLTIEGKEMLAHELTHVIQQDQHIPEGNSAALAPTVKVSQENDSEEIEAQKVAHGFARGQQTIVSHLARRPNMISLMRQTPPGTPGVSFREARGTLGEVGMAFAGYSTAEGWAFIEGPGGTAGHQWNAPGFDGVAVQVKGPFGIDILDNKSWARPGDIGSSSALTTNLMQNLDDLIAKVSTPDFNDFPRIQQVRAALTATRAALSDPTQQTPIPSNVRLTVTNFGGRSTNITTRLAALGVRFRNLMTAPQTPPAPTGSTTPPTTPSSEVGAGGTSSMTASQTPEKPLESIPTTSTPKTPGALSEEVSAPSPKTIGGLPEAQSTGEFTPVSKPASQMGTPETMVETSLPGGSLMSSTLTSIGVSIVGMGLMYLGNLVRADNDKKMFEQWLKDQEPEIKNRKAQQISHIMEIQSRGSQAYVNITIRVIVIEEMLPPGAGPGYIAYSPGYELVTVKISERDLMSPGEETLEIITGGKITRREVTYSVKETVTPGAIDYYLKLKKDLQFYERQLSNPNLAREDVTRLSEEKIKLEQQIRSFLVH